jgi:thymidylate synthase ThyX
MKYIKNEIEKLKLLYLTEASPEDITGILARYSRSKNSLEDIILEFSKDNNSELVKRIINNYGHSSIMNMGYMTCCIEGISLLALLDIFNRCPLQGGQERSTRYINLNQQIKFLLV